MRHYFSVAVALLASGMCVSPVPLLVFPPGRTLALSTTEPCALAPAVPGSNDVAQRAQKDGVPAVGCLTDDDVQPDHGPHRRRRARLPRGPVRTRMESSRDFTVQRNDQRARSATSVPSLFGVDDDRTAFPARPTSAPR